MGNPVCRGLLGKTTYCQLPGQSETNCSTSFANCGSKTCPSYQKLNPQSCGCAYPYEGTIYFRAPSFRNVTDCNRFRYLEMSLWTDFGLTPRAVSLLNPFLNAVDYLQVKLALFPTTGNVFNSSEIQRMGFKFSTQTFKPPADFGPYFFVAAPYKFLGH